MKAGAAYVPLDPQAPTLRVGYIAGNCGLRAFVTGTETSDGAWPSCVARGASISFVHVGWCSTRRRRRRTRRRRATAMRRRSRRRRRRAPGPTPARSSTRTSPTSCTPRVPPATPEGRDAHPRQRAGLRRLGPPRSSRVGPDDRLSSHAPFHFDLSIFDLYAAATAGAATLVLVPPRDVGVPRRGGAVPRASSTSPSGTRCRRS